MTNPPNPPGKPFEDQDESAARAVEDRIQQILTSGEEILHVAMQNPVTALSAAPDSVVLTNKRFIIYRPAAPSSRITSGAISVRRALKKGCSRRRSRSSR
ncbi:MAG TPA: hypothetical protein PK954_16470 [Anaerolineales bacterium]|nr:hypothetical protein [Anaerolineales bacterium]